MTRAGDLLTALNTNQVLLTRGYHPRDVGLVVGAGDAVRILPGVLANAAASQDLQIDYVIATLLTDGVVAGLTVAMQTTIAKHAFAVPVSELATVSATIHTRI
jgi:hypothetical protein